MPALGGNALAQAPARNWPSRVVRLVVPFTPGGGIDAVGRIMGARLSEIWGQQVVVENKPGAGANIGIEFVARAAPDGYTMLITAGGLTVNQYLFPSINYDPLADFAPVTLTWWCRRTRGSSRPATSSPRPKRTRASSPTRLPATAAPRT